MLGIAASEIAREYGIAAQAGRASVRRQRRVDEPEGAGIGPTTPEAQRGKS